MAFGRDSWQQMQEGRLFILYMFISACAFVFVYYKTAKVPIDLDKVEVPTKVVKQDEDEYKQMPMNHLKDPSKYNMENFANQRQQHYDARDMGKIGLPDTVGFTR
jgi:hypothetical protein